MPRSPCVHVMHLAACLWSQAFDLPETENHGGLLGYDRQDLYLSIGLQTEYGLEQESATCVKAGKDGSVGWNGETMSIKYRNFGDTVTAEVRNRSNTISAQPKFHVQHDIFCRHYDTPRLNKISTTAVGSEEWVGDSCSSSPHLTSYVVSRCCQSCHVFQIFCPARVLYKADLERKPW